MAPAVTALWRAVAPGDIDTALPDLWRAAARDSAVSRALMSNLVVVRHGRRPGDAGAAHLAPDSDLVQIAERHPARIILLNDQVPSGPPCVPSHANIGVLTFGAGAARYGVEVIAVDAVCAEASIPSIIRRLTRGDVPTTVWWTEDLSSVRPTSPLVQTGRQLLYDSAVWQDVRAGATAAMDMLSLAHAPDLADLNWQRLAPLRWALVHALRNEAPAGSRETFTATVRHRPGERASAMLTGAWLGRGLRSNRLPNAPRATTTS
jgi:hypothetical protein